MEPRPLTARRLSTTHDATARRRRGSVKLFDGLQKQAIAWDGLRKDSELWFDDGDCLVHLYSLGASQRGPSLRLRYRDVERLGCTHLLEQCLQFSHTPFPVGGDDRISDSGYRSPTAGEEAAMYQLFIATPPDLPREKAYSYHLTTRNCFAYAASRPLVGETLGSALVGVWDRLKEWSPRKAILAKFLSYCEKQGYLDTAENVDYALACLVFAEHARSRSLWSDAFVHCVGMDARLDSSHEFGALSNINKALITRASLEMELHIARVIRALGSFLEEELSTEHLGLSKPARDHLDRFRSCLYNYYVDKMGYFPPNEDSLWNKRLWTKMYHSFQTLYEYLVDGESSTDPNSTRGFNGGVCVAQNVYAFDQKHGYTPLPHPLPLLPQEPAKKRPAEYSKGLKSFTLNRVRGVTADPETAQRHALERATNSGDSAILSCQLVKEYQCFERQKLEDKLTMVEARKVRWILIYSVLQMLISITRAPNEVWDTETPTYPLCVLITGGPAWLEDNCKDADKAPVVHFSLPDDEDSDEQDDASIRLSIHPDCEADNAEDYFASTASSRRPSEMSLAMTPLPLRIVPPLFRTASIRSSVQLSVHALHRSVVGSLSRRSSVRRADSTPILQQMGTPLSEVVEQGYGSEIGQEMEKSQHQTLFPPGTTLRDGNPLADFDFGLGLDTSNEGLMVEYLQSEDGQIVRSASDSCLSVMLSDHTASSRTSSTLDPYDSPITEGSTWGDEASRRNSNSSTDISSVYRHTSEQASTLTPASKRHSYPLRPLSFGVRSSRFSVNAGCYMPTGFQPTTTSPIKPPASKFVDDKRTFSRESVASIASSIYPEDSLQAAEIEEEESRGRRRSRALDRLRYADLVTQGLGLSVNNE